MDSEAVKKEVIKQVLTESNVNNARILMEKSNENCFDKCIPKPGSSFSNSERTCVTTCVEKYMAAWNVVNTAYMRKLRALSDEHNGAFAT